MNKMLPVSFITLLMSTSLQSQDFTNLNFESARVILITNSAVSSIIATSNALPGWSVLAGGGVESPWVHYNDYNGSLFSSMTLLASNQWVIGGNFGVLVADGSISQTGLVPGGVESLLFDATSSSLVVSLGGQNLSYTAISNALNSYGASYTIYGVDISGFAGKVETLAFSSGLPDNGAVGVDDIRFSPEAVPEPSAISFFCLGSGVLFCLRRKYLR